MELDKVIVKEKMNFDNLVTQKSIYLNNRGLRDGDLDVLVDVLQKSSVLEELDLSYNLITLADGKLTAALAKNRTLRLGYLGNSQIGVEGAKKLAVALKENQTLQKIWLGRNQIGGEGAKSLANALLDNKSLEIMDLDYNNIGDMGAQGLASCFRGNESLRKILLGSNGITDEGARQFAEALKCNEVIEQLDLRRNNISRKLEDGIKAILCDSKRKRNKKDSLLQMRNAFNLDEESWGVRGSRRSLKEDETEFTKDDEISILKRENSSLKIIMARKDNEMDMLRKRIASLEGSLKYSKSIDSVNLIGCIGAPVQEDDDASSV